MECCSLRHPPVCLQPGLKFNETGWHSEASFTLLPEQGFLDISVQGHTFISTLHMLTLPALGHSCRSSFGPTPFSQQWRSGGASSQRCCCTPDTQLGRYLWFVFLALDQMMAWALMKYMGSPRNNKGTPGRTVPAVTTLQVGLCLALYLRVKQSRIHFDDKWRQREQERESLTEEL